MRFLHLTLLAGTAVLVSACANSGVRSLGGDAFVLETANVSGSRAVDAGLAEAQGFCTEHGRLFVMTNSQVSAGGYQVAFRCISPGNALPPVAMVAPSPPPRSTSTRRQREAVEAPRTVRGRRAVIETAEPTSGPALPFAASLPPMSAPGWAGASFAPPAGGFIPVFQPSFAQPSFAQSPFSQPTAFAPAGSGLAPPLPPVSTTPLFAPAPGTTLMVPPLASPRLPPADSSPLVALPRAEAVTVISRNGSSGQGLSVVGLAPQPMMQATARQQLPPVETLPMFQGLSAPAAVQSLPPAANLPLLQAQPFTPAAVQSAPLSAPPPGFGMAVPSQNPLPGATNSLPPIAGGTSRALSLPGNINSGNLAPPGFWQQGR